MKTTIIVPAYNASATLANCLTALQAEEDSICEILVIDDCSTDQTADIAHSRGIPVLRTEKRSGPAAARNLGAQKATGEILFFVDADVVIAKGALALVNKILDEEPAIAAVFGSYDDSPAETNFLSQYKNLLHHFVHHTGNPDASTFWAGCGAIRKNVFDSVQGFSAEKYPHPSIEDIELGLRLRKNQLKIRLDKQLQGKHLKRWSPVSLLRADILHRAYPWSRLIADSGEIPNELNLQTSQRLSALLAGLFFTTLFLNLYLLSWWVLIETALLLAAVIILNRDLYSFFLKKRGLAFVSLAILWHLFYYVYSSITFAYCWFRFRLVPRSKSSPASAHSPQRNVV